MVVSPCLLLCKPAIKEVTNPIFQGDHSYRPKTRQVPIEVHLQLNSATNPLPHNINHSVPSNASIIHNTGTILLASQADASTTSVESLRLTETKEIDEWTYKGIISKSTGQFRISFDYSSDPPSGLPSDYSSTLQS